MESSLATPNLTRKVKFTNDLNRGQGYLEVDIRDVLYHESQEHSGVRQEVSLLLAHHYDVKFAFDGFNGISPFLQEINPLLKLTFH